MLEDRLDGFLLFIARVVVLAEGAFHQNPEVRPGGFTDRPVDGDVLPQGTDELLGDATEGGFSKNPGGLTVCLQGFVEGEFSSERPRASPRRFAPGLLE